MDAHFAVWDVQNAHLQAVLPVCQDTILLYQMVLLFVHLYAISLVLHATTIHQIAVHLVFLVTHYQEQLAQSQHAQLIQLTLATIAALAQY